MLFWLWPSLDGSRWVHVQCWFSDSSSTPGDGGGDLVVVVLGEDLEELVEEDRQEADDHVDPLHAEKALHRGVRADETPINMIPLMSAHIYRPKSI